MTTHHLKIWPEYFKITLDGMKTFEIRVNDRDFQIGDALILEEWEPLRKVYTGRAIGAIVSYLLDLKVFGVKGYVAMAVVIDI